MSSLAQEESRSISENTTWGQRKRMADGKITLPYGQFLGYERGDDGFPQITEEQAVIVRQIYTMFLQRQTRTAKRESISRFMDDLARVDGPLAEFDEALWCATVDTVTVNSESDVAFSFRDGSTIHVDARTK